MATVSYQGPLPINPAHYAVPIPALIFPGTMPRFLQAAPPYIWAKVLQTGIVGTAYSEQISTNSLHTPITWSVIAGSLPSGLSLLSTGVISGTPAAAGSNTFTIQMVDSFTNTATQQFTINVAAAPAAGGNYGYTG